MNGIVRPIGRIGALLAGAGLLWLGPGVRVAAAQGADSASTPGATPAPTFDSICYDLADDPTLAELYPYVGLTTSPADCRYLRHLRWRHAFGIADPGPLPAPRPVRVDVVAVEQVPVPVAEPGPPPRPAAPVGRSMRKPLGDDVRTPASAPGRAALPAAPRAAVPPPPPPRAATAAGSVRPTPRPAPAPKPAARPE
ncbi:MAG: hypothetical protein ACE5HF_11155 [Gemmatimonadota bacterium]